MQVAESEMATAEVPEPHPWTADSLVALPTRLSSRPAVGMVGRETELEAVGDAVKRVVSGHRREIVLVSGEAGMGKTSLLAEAARGAYEGGACVLFGHCEEDLASPYQLFAEALTYYVNRASNEQLFHVAAPGSELTRLIPTITTRLPGLSPSKATDVDSERYLLFAATVEFLSKLSDQQPLVLVFDDLQWADKGSLQMLRHLIVAESPMRVLVLGSYRDNELSRLEPPS